MDKCMINGAPHLWIPNIRDHDFHNFDTVLVRSLLAYPNCSWPIGFWKIKWISYATNSAPSNNGTPGHGVMDFITLVNASLFSDCLLHAEGGFKDGNICLFYKKC